MVNSQPILAWTFGPTELILILLLVLLLFGGTKLPSLARGLGQSMKEFKKASREEEEEKAAEKKAEASKPTSGTN